MLAKHQIVIDCGIAGDFHCQLRESTAPSINIQAQQSFTQYNYYLLLNNYLTESCQLFLQAQNSGKDKLLVGDNIFLKIFYQDQQLFDGTFADFLAERIDLLNIGGQSSKLYKLELNLGKLQEDFSLNFDLNFTLACHEQSDNQQVDKQVLGSITEHKELIPDQATETNATKIWQQRIFLSIILLSFLFLLILIFFFYRSKFMKAKKYQVAQRKDNL